VCLCAFVCILRSRQTLYFPSASLTAGNCRRHWQNDIWVSTSSWISSASVTFRPLARYHSTHGQNSLTPSSDSHRTQHYQRLSRLTDFYLFNVFCYYKLHLSFVWQDTPHVFDRPNYRHSSAWTPVRRTCKKRSTKEDMEKNVPGMFRTGSHEIRIEVNT